MTIEDLRCWSPNQYVSRAFAYDCTCDVCGVSTRGRYEMYHLLNPPNRSEWWVTVRLCERCFMVWNWEKADAKTRSLVRELME